MTTPRPTIRIDKWLWFARFFKTRSLAAKIVSGGHVRVSGTRVSKPSSVVGPGDVLTFLQGNRIVVAEVLDIGVRRGPAPEAQALYRDLSEPVPRQDSTEPQAPRAGPRPTQKDRRAARRMKTGDLE